MEGELLGAGDFCGQSPVCVPQLPKGPRGLRSSSWRTDLPPGTWAVLSPLGELGGQLLQAE